MTRVLSEALITIDKASPTVYFLCPVSKKKKTRNSRQKTRAMETHSAQLLKRGTHWCQGKFSGVQNESVPFYCEIYIYNITLKGGLLCFTSVHARRGNVRSIFVSQCINRFRNELHAFATIHFCNIKPDSYFMFVSLFPFEFFVRFPLHLKEIGDILFVQRFW